MGRDKGKSNSEFSPHIANKIELKPANWFRPYERNARTHSETQLDEIAASMREFGFTNPILAKADGTIIAGHGRHEAATSRLGLTDLPVIILDYLSENQVKALIIADNKIALNAGWDEDILSAEIASLEAAGYDLSLTGFDEIELGDLMPPEEEEGADEDEENEGPFIETPEKPVSKLGDVWILGSHRLICGDSTKKETLETLLGKERADLIHTDPPYNVDYSNADRPKAGKKDLGKIENDKMSDKDFAAFLAAAFTNAFNFAKPDSSIYIWYADKETVNFTKAATSVGWEFAQTIIWKKPMLLGRSRYQWAHEPCLFLVRGKPYFTKDRTKTTVWDFGGYDKSKNVHPTQKPVVVPAEAIQNSSKKKDIVLDLFGGSGSTLIACERHHRRARVVELDPAYVDVIVLRWQEETGQKAMLDENRKTFADMKKVRQNGKGKE